MGFLARREHSRKELDRKLRARGYNQDIIEPLIEQLAREGLQSDERFVESFLHSRLNKGVGPLRLARELRERGIDDSLAESVINGLDIDWMDALNSVRQKKFGSALPRDFKGQVKESRFLQYRGFSPEQIRQLYKSED